MSVLLMPALPEVVRIQQERGFRRRAALGQATACWAHLHGLTMLAIDGRLVPGKVGNHAIEDALTTLSDGLMLDAEQHKRRKQEKA
ncbi:hypothetical protein [Burkholderia ambifaria]|uniref:hypothetical protein n=1 Tax=Burkholderia ambifaria TaxID=152480 RepID=UPI001E42B5FD|nr:hypothetical protein [Burkholderia ambifaria]UEP50725.1 hypothetical protein LMA00_27425 [Burkholderia ambifaria]